MHPCSLYKNHTFLTVVGTYASNERKSLLTGNESQFCSFALVISNYRGVDQYSGKSCLAVK